MDKQTILVVDDELVGRQLLNAVLISDGYNVLLAECGGQAIEVAEKHLPDLILMDVMMPDMDGFTTIEKIKDIESLSHTPVILVTALDDRDNRIKGLEAGATDYITKPFDRIEVLAKIKNHIRKATFTSGKSFAEKESDLDKKLQTLINEIFKPFREIEHPAFHASNIATEDINGYFSESIQFNSEGHHYFLSGSDAPTADDKYQLALINTWISQLITENKHESLIDKQISEKIKHNSDFGEKNWWLIHLFLNNSGNILISGVNMEIICFPKSDVKNLPNRQDICFNLKDSDQTDITDMNYIILAKNALTEITGVDSVYDFIWKLAEEKKYSDIKTSLLDLLTRESNKNIFAVGLQITQ